MGRGDTGKIEEMKSTGFPNGKDGARGKDRGDEDYGKRICVYWKRDESPCTLR